MGQIIHITAEGHLTFVWDDDLATVFDGKLSIKRASHVEPDDRGEWWADLSPVGGPKLGPYILRGTALHDERMWLNNNLARLA